MAIIKTLVLLFLLLQGIIYTTLDEKENAMTWWKKFARIVKVESELPLFPPN